MNGWEDERKSHLGLLDIMLGAIARFELSTATCKSTTPGEPKDHNMPTHS